MKNVNWQAELKITKRQIKELDQKREELKFNIKSFGKELVKELQKISGWECMIQSCWYHMKEYKDPNEFFDICSYEFDFYDSRNILYVKKYYAGADPDGYVVLEINLEGTLEKQVENMLSKITQTEKNTLVKEYNKDMDVLKKLKMSVIDFKTWMQKKNNQEKKEEE